MAVFVVNGLGYGDEGKGTTTHWLCWRHNAHTVVRTGGPQAFHRVVTGRNREHVHSQFGSGTLLGARTHLSKNMLIDPSAILKEGEALMYEHGMRGVFSYMTIHEDALIITPFQAIASRLRELSRGANRQGTVGIGVGETILDSEVIGDEALYARDMGKSYLPQKLAAMRDRKRNDLCDVIEGVSDLPFDIRAQAEEEIKILSDESVIQWAVEKFNKVAELVRIVDTSYLDKKILQQEGTVVFEGSQGVLLDRLYGFHPHTTKVRTIPESALSLIDECGYDGEVSRWGVLRAYHTRHGAGPFVSEDSKLTSQLPDAYNVDHPWQGSFRVGYFDVLAARYALDACGGPEALDGLVLSCVDRLSNLEPWNISEAYSGPNESNFFTKNDAGLIGDITVRHGTGAEQLQRQEKLGELLRECTPELTEIELPDDRADRAALCAEVLQDRLSVPVVVVSAGPTERDKVEIV